MSGDARVQPRPRDSASTEGSKLSDAHYDWIARFCGVDLRAARAPSDEKETSGGRPGGRRTEGDLPYVSMQLPEPPKGGKVIEMPALDFDPRTDDDQMARDIISARDQAKRDHDAGMTKKASDNANLVEHAISRIDAQKANYRTIVHGASLLLQAYAKTRIAKLKDAEEAEAASLFGPLVGAVLDVLGAELLPLITVTKVGKYVLDAAYGKFKAEVTGDLAKKVSGASSLDAAMDAIVVQSISASDALADSVSRGIRDPLEALSRALAARAALTETQENTLDTLRGRSTDEGLEALGIPTAMTAKAVQVKLYGTLVKKFEAACLTYEGRKYGIEPDMWTDKAAQDAAQKAMRALPR